MLILLFVLVVIFGLGGLSFPAYRTGGLSLAGIVAIVLVLWLVFGGAHGRIL